MLPEISLTGISPVAEGDTCKGQQRLIAEKLRTVSPGARPSGRDSCLGFLQCYLGHVILPSSASVFLPGTGDNNSIHFVGFMW